MTKINKENYTRSLKSQIVNVGAFRNKIDHLMKIINCDSHSCVGAKEITNCVSIAKRVGAELIATDCKRATLADWERREDAINRSTKYINKNSDTVVNKS